MKFPSTSTLGRLRLPMDGRTSYAYLHSLIEHNPIAIIVLDSKHKFQMCNAAFERLFQYGVADYGKWGIDSLIAGPDFLQEATQLTHNVLAGERVHTLTKRRRKDGLLIDVEVYGVPLILDGRVEGIYGIYQDVTERMRLAEAMQAMTERLNTAREEERRRLARDLHDSFSQELTLLNWNLRRLEHFLPEDSESAREVLQQTRELANLCVGQIRSASFLLHPPQLGEADLYTAIRWLAEGFERRSGIAVKLRLQTGELPLPTALQSTLYRVVQEALANVLRHARESSVVIMLHQKRSHCELTVENQLTTPAMLSPQPPAKGVGLTGMQERLKELGGSLEIRPSARGLRIRARIPISETITCAS